MMNNRQDFDPASRAIAHADGNRIETLERALALCEQRLRLLVEHSPALTLEIDTEGRIAAASAELCRRLGYAADALIGQPLGRLLPDWDRPGLLAELTATGATHDVVARHGEGMRCELAAKLLELPFEDGTSGYLLLARDVTAVRRGLRQLRVQAEVIDRTRDAVVVLDELGCVVSWNRSAERLYGRSARSMTGQAFEQMFDAAERVRLQAAIDCTVFGAEAPTDVELRGSATRGRRCRLALRLSRIAGAERGRELLLVFGVEAAAGRRAARRSVTASCGMARATQ